ncbi:MAG: DUF456 domain-containing protein [Tetrasphaera sp.]
MQLVGLDVFGDSAAATWVPGLIIIAGILGVIVPVIPGLIVALLGVLIWALDQGSTGGWIVFAICVLLYAAGLTLQFLIPGRRMKAAGVANSTLLIGLLVGIVGFFVVPVIGGPLGFVLGIYLVELSRSQDKARAWTSTKAALRGVLHSMGIELLAGLAILTTWVIGVIAT